MNTVWPAALSRNADWPYHSTCMLFLRSGRAKRSDWYSGVVVLIAPAAHQRGERGHQAGGYREREGLVQSGAARRRDEMGEERVARDRGAIGGGERGERMRPEQVLDRVVAEECREQDRDRRQVGNAVRGGCAHAMRL